MSKKENQIDLGIIRRLLAYTVPYKKIFVLALFLTVLVGLLAPIRPYLIMQIVDEYIGKNNPQALLNWTLILVGILLFQGIVQFVNTYTTNWLGQSIIRDVRTKLFKHIIKLRTRYFDTNPIGAMVTRAVSDIEALADIFSNGLLSILTDLLQLFFIFALMFYTNWKFTLLVLIPIPLLLMATQRFRKAIKKAYQQESTQVSKLNTFVQEHLSGIAIMQMFNRERQEYKKFEEINQAHKQAHIKSVWAYSIFFPVVEILSSISIACIIFYATYRIKDLGFEGLDIFSDSKNTKEGQLFAFILWVNMLYRPIRMLADKFNTLQRGMVRGQRIFKVLDSSEFIENNGNIVKVRFEGNIELKNVHFAYDNENFVLKNINLSVKKGETIALVGATGAGKSSIINLISRFYEYQKGEILLDGEEIRDYELNFLRSRIAIVLQDVFLFSGTIRENITMFDENIKLSEIKAAAKAVGAHQFINKLPNTYDYDVQERGATLSTGQRQLISFIRAYVYNPDILILDEATSSIDTETEELIKQATEKLTENRTSIIIAHRLSTIQNADKIIVLEKGEIVEVGTHDELLKKEGYYKKLHDAQMETS